MRRQAIILAGGFGTRLREVVNNVPKPMAPIGDKPFLAYLVDDLLANNFDQIILSLHYMPELIQDYFKTNYPGQNIQYAVESEPLGTGGAVKYALTKLASSEPVLILNGDSYLQVNYNAIYQAHTQSKADLTMLLREVENSGRYGRVCLDEYNKIISFEEKSNAGQGLINAGLYLLNPSVLELSSLPNTFSLENDFFKPYLPSLNAKGFVVDGYFIDIGIPEDYARAQVDLQY